MPQLEGRVFTRLQQYDALPTELKDEVSALVEYLTTNQNDVFGLHHANLIKTVRSVRAKPLTEKITAWLLHREAPTEPAGAPTEAVEETKQEESKPAEPEEAKPAEAEETKPAATEEEKPAEAAETPAEAAPAPTEEEAAKAKEAEAKAKEEAKEAAAKAKEEAKQAALKAKEEAAAKAKAEQEVHDARVAHAKKLLEALVLKGFVTLYKEADKIVTTPPTPETFVFGDRDLFVPLAKEVAAEPIVAPAPAASAVSQPEASTSQATPAETPAEEEKPAETPAETPAPTPTPAPAPLPTTVWDLIDGAVFAAALKRKAGFLAPLTAGKDVYAIVNGRTKTLTLFESDVGRVPIVEFGYEGTSAAFDKSHFVHGVKIWNDTITELLNATTKLEREGLVHALLAIGITYHEELAPGIEKIEKIYELKDTDIDGQEVVFDKYKGKVLLIVNVSSKCGLTPTNYPELVALHDKYKGQGFEVLAFPCNQFMGQEPGTHEEIKEFVTQYNATFQFFSKGDVNGVDTRPVFAFLKHKLPEPYIQWNFTKFLVDRNGVPSKRFGPRELPLSFESEIVKLIAEQVKPEVVENPETPETAATETTEAAVAAGAATETAVVAVEATETPAPAVEAPAPVETPAPAPVEETKAPAPAEPTPEAAPAEEAAPPAEVVKPVAEAPKPEAPVETKVEAAAPPQPEVVVEQTKVEEVVATPQMEEQTKTESAPVESNQAPSEATIPATKVEPAVESTPAVDAPAQGFTVGNEPSNIP